MKITEEDLTEFVRKDLDALGYITYAEVLAKGTGSPRCDMIARIEDKNHKEYGKVLAFESKLAFNFSVLNQANYYVSNKKANETYIICPTTFKKVKTRKFAREVCKLLGIGVIEVNIKTGKYFMTVKPKFIDKINPPKLYEEQKFIKASNAQNKYMTPFKATVSKIVQYMEDKDSEILLNIIKSVEHHYSSDMNAIKNIKNMIEKGVIKGFNLTKINNKLIIKKQKF